MMRASFFVAAVILCVFLTRVIAQSAPAGASSVTGTVTNATTQAPVSGASLELTGPAVDVKTKSDAAGAFSFNGLSAGTYSIRTTAAGYQTSTSSPFTVGASESVQLAIALPPVSASSLRTIASIRVNGQQSVNTTTTPTVSITNRQFVTSGQVLVTQALEQTPGVTVEHYDGGLGSVTTLTIRGAGGFTQTSNTGYEVLVLQDGQPMRNGQYGDADLSTLTPAIYSRAEVLKGVGGTSLFGANSIGGTLNLVTRDPLAKEGGEFIGGLGGFGTTSYDLIETNTIGRFGYIFDLHRLNTTGPVPGNFIADYRTNVFGSNGNPCTGIADCGPFWHPTQTFDLKSDLFKVKYQFSPVTYLTLSSQSESDLRDQLGLLTNPTTASDGSAFDPLGVPYFFGFPGDQLWNIQPKFSADLHTQIGDGDFILRSYGGILERVVDGNGEPAGICCFLQRSVDRLYGDEAYWTRLFGRHTITVAAGANGDFFFFGSRGSGSPLSFNDLSYTSGKQIERTYMARDEYQASPRLNLTLTGYYSTYDTLQVKRFDPRLGVVYRPDVSTAVRFSVASGFAAPRLSDLYTPLQTADSSSVFDARCPTGAPYFGFCAAPDGNPNLKSETAVGYDLGVDRTFGYRNRGFVSLDLYRTNLHGHLYTVDLPAPAGTPTFDSGAPILFIAQPINLAGSVYTGFEFNGAYPFTHNFSVTGYYTTQAAYPYGLDDITQINAQDTVNNSQFQGVPVHMLGYGLRYVNDAGAEGFFRGDYQMWNNSYAVDPFWIYNAGVTLPVKYDSDLTFAWQNIFNKNATIFSVFDGGVPYPGFTGPFPETAHPTYPHSVMVTLTHRWGSLKNP